MIITQKNGRKKTITTEEEARLRLLEMSVALTDHERALLNSMESEIVCSNDFGLIRLANEHVFHTEPVSMAQFIDDPYYLGESCTTLFPELRKDLIDLFDHPYREVIYSGAIGVGKTFSLSISICRVLYELSCMVSPQQTFGLAASSEMIITLVSKNLPLARAVMKSAVDIKLRESPYFMTKFTPKFKSDQTLFPNNICVSIGSYMSDRVIGTNIISAALDEANFPPKVNAQQISTAIGQRATAANYDIVEKTYRSLVRRIKSRFQAAGSGFSGMVIMASSAATLESFTERKIRESKDDPDIFVRDHTQWTAKGKEHFSGKVFWILCSESSSKSRILTDEEAENITDDYLDMNDAYLLDVPIEFKEDFESNMEDSLRDLAGVATQAISSFMQRMKAVEECIDYDRVHPIDTEEWVAGSKASIDWDYLTLEFTRKLPGGFDERAFAPRRNPKALRWVHLDTSVSGDSTGLCIVHVDRYIEVVRTDLDGGKYTEVAPFYVVDFMLRINPPPGEQIYLPDLRQIVYNFMEHGYSFAGLSTDTYQYVEMHQQAKRRGLTPKIISMDTSTAPYDELKAAFYENRIEIYEYKPFIDELKSLEYDRLRGKIDHPQAGSKDVADSVAGACFGIMQASGRSPMVTGVSRKSNMEHEHSWVSPLIPSESVDRDAVDDARAEKMEYMAPIFFGDD